jgi:Rrf2 family protein
LRINKKLQYGLLFVIYLSRSGRSTVDIVSKNISVPKNFLEQIARQLRLSGVIRSIRGPSGGYELNTNCTIGDVFAALKQDKLLDPRDMAVLKRGQLEHRALAMAVQDLYFAQAQVLTRRIVDVVRELVSAETHIMNSMNVVGMA